MTLIHILNFSIPITMMLVIGYTVDKMCQPDSKSAKPEESAFPILEHPTPVTQNLEIGS